MKTRTIEELKKTDSLALTAIISYWKDYDTDTVSLAILELKKRGSLYDKSVQGKLQEFVAKSGGSLEAITKSALGKNGLDQNEFGKIETIPSEAKSMENISEKYPALRTIIGLFQVLGFLTILGTLIISFYLFSNDQGAVTIIATVIYGLLTGIFTFAMAEIIKVFIDIEKNTRKK